MRRLAAIPPSPPPYQRDPDIGASMAEAEDRIAFSAAKRTRDTLVIKFKRDFLLAVASREATAMDVPSAMNMAGEAAALLFPEVSDSNADEYLSRSY